MIFYHATHIANMQSILQNGIRPRTKDCYHQLLQRLAQEYGFDYDRLVRQEYPDPWESQGGGFFHSLFHNVLGFAENRRCGEVSLSGGTTYAFGNALAGYELEMEVREYLENLRHFLETGKIDRFGHLSRLEHNKAWYAYRRALYDRFVPNWQQIVIFEVDLDPQVLRPEDQVAIQRITQLYPKYTIEDLDEVRTPFVPPERIVGWRLVSKLKGTY